MTTPTEYLTLKRIADRHTGGVPRWSVDDVDGCLLDYIGAASTGKPDLKAADRIVRDHYGPRVRTRWTIRTRQGDYLTPLAFA